jgi:hypothetical protein
MSNKEIENYLNLLCKNQGIVSYYASGRQGMGFYYLDQANTACYIESYLGYYDQTTIVNNLNELLK